MIKPQIIFTSYDSLRNPYYAGGGAQAIHSVAKRLVRWYNILVVTAAYPGAKDYVMDNVCYRHIGISLHPKLDQLLFSSLLPFKLLLARASVIVESLTPPFSATLLPLFQHAPVIALVHMLSGSDMQRKYKLPFLFFERLGLKFYNNFIVLSQHWYRVVKTYNSHARISVINNGVEKRSIQKFTPATTPFFLFLGRLEVNQKGLDLLIDAYAKSNLTIPLFIAGTGEASQIALIKDLIKISKCRGKIKLIGKVEGVRKYQLLAQSLCLIIPSRYETFSMSALESLSYGKPIVCYNIPGLQWLPHSVSLRIKPFSVKGLSLALKKIAASDTLRARMSQDAHSLSSRYDWDRLSLKYKRAIEAVI